MNRGVLAAIVAAAGVFAVSHSAAAQVPRDASWEEAYITSADGTRLHADVFRPKGLAATEKTPVLLNVSPYHGLAEGSGVRPPGVERPTVRAHYQDIFDRAFSRGYSIVQVTTRGFGASGGCSDYYGPNEQADAEVAIRWAATRPWSTGKVGTFGGSADAAPQVAGLARRVPGHAAAMILHPVSSAYRATYMNRNRLHNGNLGVAHLIFQMFSAYPAPLSSPPDQQAEALAGLAEMYKCAPELVTEPENPDPESRFWRARDMIRTASGNSVPTLWVGSFWDNAAMPDQVHEIYGSQRGPKRVWWGQTPHIPTSVWEQQAGRGRQFVEELFRWFDRYVKGLPARQAPVERDPPAVVQEGFEGRWRSEAGWPPADASYHALAVRPGSYLDAEGNKGEPGFRPGSSCTRVENRCPPVPTGIGSWTFTRPLPYDAHIAGIPRLRVDIEQRAANVNVIALLYDVDARNEAALMARGAFVSRASGAAAFDLYPADWRLRRGHRIGLLLSGSDEFHFSPGTSGTTVEVKGGRLSLPFLTCERSQFLDGGPSQWIKERQTFGVDPSGASPDSSFPPRQSRTGDCAPAALRAGCLSRRSPIGPRNIGRVRLGYTRRRLLRVPVTPVRRTRRSYRYCVKRSRGRVSAVFSRRGRVALVATTARAHGNRGVRPGVSARALRRAYPRRRAIGRGLYHANRRSPRLIGIRKGRVRFVAVANRRLLRNRGALRRHLRRAGL